jgi:5-(aminomethyl)-3-furanmethanol phosphate kinase
MTRGALVDIVVKVGGGLLASPGHLDAVLAELASAASTRRLLVIPGGGPFADAVREVDRELALSDEAAHWMAVLAMDQYAHLLVSRLRTGGIVSDAAAIAAQLDQGRLPVLAPFRWLRDADPLPHSWDVTSDSIAAWFAGEVGARRLVLVKPLGAGDQAVDPYFHRVMTPGMAFPHVVPADQIGALRGSLTV